MAKYVVYDNESDVYVPSGKVYTAKEWLDKYAWAKKAKMVISGGVINGAFVLVYDDFVERMRKSGVDFEGCETDQDYLDAIEAFEDNQQKVASEQEETSVTLTAEERIANALEDLILMRTMGDEDVDAILNNVEEEIKEEE